VSSLKIDAFPHICTPRFFDRLKDIRPAFVASNNIRVRPALWDLDERFRMMDRFQDYVQVLTLSQPPIEQLAEGPLAASLAQLANDEMAELCRKHPDRFLGFAASVALDDVDTALREVERAVNELGALGVQIFSNVKGHPLDEPRFEPLFAMMAQLERVVWLHPIRTVDHPDYPSEAESKYGLFFKLGWPYETSVAISRLIFSGIMDRYPRLRVLTHHAGGIIPHLAGRIALQHDTAEQRQGMGVPDAFDPERTLALYKRFYGDAVFSGAHHPLECAVSFYGVDHILFGTDMPYGEEGGALFIRETIAAIQELPGSEADRQAIFEGNARTLLGLPS
jgi:predicted TIM-barrel fold metal-dependent hydrolase